MKFKFRLEKLLNLHSLNLKMLQRELSEKYQKLGEQEIILKNLFLKRSESFSFAQTAGIGVLSEEFRKWQDIRIEKQKEIIKQAHGQVENVRIRLIEKDRELKMLERLKSKRSEDFYKERERLEQIEIDDTTSSKKARSAKLV